MHVRAVWANHLGNASGAAARLQVHRHTKRLDRDRTNGSTRLDLQRNKRRCRHTRQRKLAPARAGCAKPTAAAPSLRGDEQHRIPAPRAPNSPEQSEPPPPRANDDARSLAPPLPLRPFPSQGPPRKGPFDQTALNPRNVAPAHRLLSIEPTRRTMQSIYSGGDSGRLYCYPADSTIGYPTHLELAFSSRTK